MFAEGSGTLEEDEAVDALSDPLNDPLSEAACRGSSQIIASTHDRTTNKNSRSREAGRRRRLASGCISCMLRRYRLRCISSTSVSPLAMAKVVSSIPTHFLPSTGYCTTALASMIFTCRSNASQQAFRARSLSPAASVALIFLALVQITRERR